MVRHNGLCHMLVLGAAERHPGRVFEMKGNEVILC